MLDHIPDMLNFLPQIPIKLPKNLKNLRVTTSVFGKQNYSRYEMEDRVGNIISKRLGLNYLNSTNLDTQNALWCRFHISENKGILGFRFRQTPLHRRFWRTQGIAGALHPPIAAAMAFLADLQPGQCVLDPFAGSGTLLIEAGLQNNALSLNGCDISQQSIDCALHHAEVTQISLNLKNLDSSHAVLQKVDRLISNPPWGHMVEMLGYLDDKTLIKILFENLNENGRAVVLTDITLDLPQRLMDQNIKSVFMDVLRIAGRLVHLIIIDKDAKLFSNIVIGRSLKKAWNLKMDLLFHTA